MCRSYSQRPSSIVGIDDDPEFAYDFDLAINFIHREERNSRAHSLLEQIAKENGDKIVALITLLMDD